MDCVVLPLKPADKSAAGLDRDPNRSRLMVAAGIVETIAFDIARDRPAETVVDLLAIAREIEKAATRLEPAD